MWLLLGFVVHHLYSAVLTSVVERNGDDGVDLLRQRSGCRASEARRGRGRGVRAVSGRSSSSSSSGSAIRSAETTAQASRPWPGCASGRSAPAGVARARRRHARSRRSCPICGKRARAILVDAVRTGDPPGTIVRLAETTSRPAAARQALAAPGRRRGSARRRAPARRLPGGARARRDRPGAARALGSARPAVEARIDDLVRRPSRRPPASDTRSCAGRATWTTRYGGLPMIASSGCRAAGGP